MAGDREDQRPSRSAHCGLFQQRNRKLRGGRQPIDAPGDVAARVAAMNDIVYENAADRAAGGFRNVEYLDGGLRRPQGCEVDGQSAHDRTAAVKDNKVEREARKFGRPRVGYDQIGAAIAALVLETVELDTDLRRCLGRSWRRAKKERPNEDKRKAHRGRPGPAGKAHSTDETVAPHLPGCTSFRRSPSAASLTARPGDR